MDAQRRTGRRGAWRGVARPRLLWTQVRDSFWFIPGLATLAAIVLAMVAVRIPAPRTDTGPWAIWDRLFGGGAEGARGVLDAIASSLITVTGVVFSVTIVALQLASSQFTPRLLRSFMADRVNQAVLGIMIGTFTYSLLVLRTISTTDGGEVFVPQVAVAIAVVLLLVSVGALIVFIDHAARSMQASFILHRESRLALARIAELFPERRDGAAPPAPAPAIPEEPAATVRATGAGYIQAVYPDGLAALGDRGGGDAAAGGRTQRALTIRMEQLVGAFVIPGTPLASVWPAEAADDAVRAAVREAFVIGPARTPEQDVEFAVIEISDIAARALSPGINDPTTAMIAIDRLTEVLAEAAQCVPAAAVRPGHDDRILFIARHTEFERLLALAFDAARHYGAGYAPLVAKLLDALTDLAAVVPAEHHAALGVQVTAVLDDARRAITNPADLAAVERLGRRVRAQLAHRA